VGDEIEDLVLARGELGERPRRRRARVGEQLEDPVGDRRPEDRLAVADRANRAEDVV
jgi:hypothetical protein